MIRPLLAVSALVCLCSLAAAEERRAVPLYTNADLERLAPRRAETGVTSTPAVPPRTSAEATRDDRGPSEAHWRREAERVRVKVRDLRDRAQDLRERAEDQRAEAQESPRSGGGRRRSPVAPARPSPLERQAERLERQAREEEDLLAEKARRAGALPGWIR